MENVTVDEKLSAVGNEAMELDLKIKHYANMAWVNLMESAKCLKKMRDTKLYTQLGYESFDDYAQKSLGIKERQAYTYISAYENLGERFLQLNANIGITKLSLLSQVPAPDRQEVVDNNDIAGMTVEEVKRLVSENNAKGEQITMLSDELEKAKTELEDREDELDRIEELERELEAERQKPAEVAVREPSYEEMEEIRKSEYQKAKKEAESEFAAERKKLREEKNKAVEKARTDAEKMLEEYKQKAEQLDSAAAEAIRKAGELEKQLAVTSSPDTVQFSFYFEALQADYKKILSSIKKLIEEGNNSGAKFKDAMLKYCEIMKNGIEGV